MKDEEIDAMLTVPADLIEPSSGFAGSVMEAVRAQALTPAPLRFPWRRAMPGIVVGGAGLVRAIFELVPRSIPRAVSVARFSGLSAAWFLPATTALAWTVGGLLVTAIVLTLSTLLTRWLRFSRVG